VQGSQPGPLPPDQRGRVAQAVQQPDNVGGIEMLESAGVALNQLTRAGQESEPIIGPELAEGSNGHAIEVVADQLLARRVHGPIIPLLNLLVEPARRKSRS